MSEEATLDASTTKRLILHRWLYWGVAPIAVALALTLIAGHVVSPRDLSEIQVGNVLELFLAIGAGLFLLGFAIDGHYLNPERLAKAALAAAQGSPERASDSADNPHGPFVRNRVLTTASVVSLLGIGIGASAVGDVVAGGTLRQGMLMIVLGALYEMYVLSRHGHYRDIIDGYAQIIAAHEEAEDDDEAEGDTKA
ncbi:MAG: hypothetical protein PVH68_19210 [Armatimonadota bacterium]